MSEQRFSAFQQPRMSALLLGLVVAAGSGVPGPASADKKADPVYITGQTDPIVVTGTVAVGAPVQINTSSPLPVNITNTAPLPVAVANATSVDPESRRQPFNQVVRVEMLGGSGRCDDTEGVIVPPGKRLIVEHLSASAAFPLQPAPDLRLIAIGLAPARQGADLLVTVPAAVPGIVGTGVFSYVYAGAGQQVGMRSDESLKACAFTNLPNVNEVTVRIAGYLTDR